MVFRKQNTRRIIRDRKSVYLEHSIRFFRTIDEALSHIKKPFTQQNLQVFNVTKTGRIAANLFERFK